jgi:leucyl aminopeptidase (aminopeptidase T)
MDFSDGRGYDRSLVKGAEASMKDVLAVKKDERVLIISNPNREVRMISMALYDAALKAGAKPVLMYQVEKGHFDFAEEEVVKAIASEPDIVLSISSNRLGKDKWGLKHGYKGKKRKYDHIFDQLYEEKKMRSFWSPGVTCDTFSRTVPIDYTLLRKDCKRLSAILTSCDSIHVTAPGGTDFTLGVKGRKARADDGDFRTRGRGGNVPSGEVYISPALGTSNGMIAYDGSIVVDEGEVVIRKPIVVDVKDGYISHISGGSEAVALKKTISMAEAKAKKMVSEGLLKPAVGESYAKNASSIGELGIGLNRKARIVALMLEDEKVYGTCHFAVGSNYDGDAESLIHLDGIVKRPTIAAVSGSGKETQIMADGKLAWTS